LLTDLRRKAVLEIDRKNSMLAKIAAQALQIFPPQGGFKNR